MEWFRKPPEQCEENHMLTVFGWLRRRASFAIYDGTPKTYNVMNGCSAFDTHTAASLIYTRDEGMHTGGWWKNPDYARCLHLSLTFWDIESKEARGKDKTLTNLWLDIVFGANKCLIWGEPPFSEGGKKNETWHYRLFVMEDWRTAILPRGEVYSQAWTPPGFKSFSELQAEPMQHQADIGD